MGALKFSFAAVATLFATSALAGFDPSSKSNVAVYWGQNSAGQANSQKRLAEYCNDDKIDYREDIKACQAKGKTILLSIGGMTYSQGGFANADEARRVADNVWDMFGSNTAAPGRPFGSAVIDGFDMDFEATALNLAPFANQLRTRMNSAGKPMYMTAAPQCVYPDAAMNEMLNGAVDFDFIMIQFYNNWCGVINFRPDANPNPYNFGEWDAWARQTSRNKDVKVLVGVPASAGAGGGYIPAGQLDPVLQFSKRYSSFGGAMMWDMSQLFRNSGFLDGVASSLNKSGGTDPPPTTPPGDPQPEPTSGPSPGKVPQYGQCGGEGYTGPTECEPPYTCQGTRWWKSCK
ncbi:hypothetical protein DL766_001499 [Monosporascus sp. MC13-8B]|uniref:chitinase n=1 Tax=Monosporascus cannonballus TaxID=155416 RepID=A0ABY0H3K7_9PEZI|nr:hypothetical protein DL762_006253 [Monosporascus cannonballus]RYO99836.1 hypothetical protein DL763_001226 [Monosporascus cannonballus]RYP37505.1 hypothetical protein DL766_001499 [Monosporascus sp. MC13-8B]